MSTSEYDAALWRRMLGCTLSAVVCGVVSAIYHTFGHGVFSWAMALAFLPALLGGAIHLFLWEMLKGRFRHSDTMLLWQDVLFCGLAAITAGMYYQGIVEIAGVDGGWEKLFYALGAVLSALGTVGMWLWKEGKKA